jgi:hypothetical protein
VVEGLILDDGTDSGRVDELEVVAELLLACSLEVEGVEELLGCLLEVNDEEDFLGLLSEELACFPWEQAVSKAPTSKVSANNDNFFMMNFLS